MFTPKIIKWTKHFSCALANVKDCTGSFHELIGESREVRKWSTVVTYHESFWRFVTMAKDAVDFALILMLIVIMLSFVIQLTLLFLILCRIISRRRSSLEYTLIAVIVHALVQWAANFISVYRDKDRLNTTSGQLSMFEMSMFLISTHTFMSLSTSAENNKISAQKLHLCFAALIGILTITVYVLFILDTIHKDPYQSLLWTINLVTLCCIGHLCYTVMHRQ